MPSADEIEELLRARLVELQPYVDEYQQVQRMLGERRLPARIGNTRAQGEDSIRARVAGAVIANGSPLRAHAIRERLREDGHEYSWISVSNALYYAERSGALRRVARGLYGPPPEEG